MPSTRAKLRAQREGLGVGWLPKSIASPVVKSGELVEMRTADPREPNTLYIGWRGDHEGRALDWWVEQVKHPKLASWLVRGLSIDT